MTKQELQELINEAEEAAEDMEACGFILAAADARQMADDARRQLSSINS